MRGLNKLNLEEVPKELCLIFDLLKVNGDLNQESFTHIDWNLLIDLAMHHRVYPVLYGRLKVLSETTRIPTFVLESLSEQYRRNTFQMLHFSAEMNYVSQLFAQHQIPLLFLKGPTLGHDLYGDISLRTSGDLDVLVPIEELTYTEDILRQAGYKKDDYIKSVLNDWKWRHHHVTYIHPDKKIKLEVHWRLNPGPAKEPTFNDLWKRKKQSSLAHSVIYTLGNEDLLLFLTTHGARHGWSRLRWLLDIHQLLNKELNWKIVHKQFKTYHFSHIGGQALILSTEIFGTKIPDELKSSFINRRSLHLAKQALFYVKSMINLHTEPVPENIARYHKRHLFSLMSLQQKLLFMMSILHPYPEDKETLPLPRQLHFLYFPLRPFLWAWRKTKAYAFS